MNMKFAAIAALGALSLAAIAPQAAAADNGFYLGAGITQTEFDVESRRRATERSTTTASRSSPASGRSTGLRSKRTTSTSASEFDDGSDVTIDSQCNHGVCACSSRNSASIDLYARARHGQLEFGLRALRLRQCVGRRLGTDVRRGRRRALRQRRRARRVRAVLDERSTIFDTDINTISLSVTYTFL